MLHNTAQLSMIGRGTGFSRFLHDTDSHFRRIYRLFPTDFRCDTATSTSFRIFKCSQFRLSIDCETSLIENPDFCHNFLLLSI